MIATPCPVELLQRSDAFKRTYAKWPASWPWFVQERGRWVMYGKWLIGNDYTNKSSYYGAFPHGLLERIMALFPDADGATTLHAFSGSLPAGNYQRCDLVQPAEFQCSVNDLPAHVSTPFRLVIADPPYSAEDAIHYNTGMVDRGRCTRALAQVTAPGGHLVWLDTVWPMHRKSEWTTVGRITIVRSTNHRVRELSIFERTVA